MNLKTIITTAALACAANLSAQWTYETIDNGFDGKFKIAICQDGQGNFAKLYGGQGEPLGLLLYTGYNCFERPKVEVILLINGQWVKYETVGLNSSDSKKVYIFDDIRGSEANWKAATEMRIRHDDDHCGTRIYTFSMKGSTAAFDFMVAR
jgi:hypothetical protein